MSLTNNRTSSLTNSNNPNNSKRTSFVLTPTIINNNNNRNSILSTATSTSSNSILTNSNNKNTNPNYKMKSCIRKQKSMPILSKEAKNTTNYTYSITPDGIVANKNANITHHNNHNNSNGLGAPRTPGTPKLSDMTLRSKPSNSSFNLNNKHFNNNNNNTHVNNNSRIPRTPPKLSEMTLRSKPSHSSLYSNNYNLLQPPQLQFQSSPSSFSSSSPKSPSKLKKRLSFLSLKSHSKNKDKHIHNHNHNTGFFKKKSISSLDSDLLLDIPPPLSSSRESSLLLHDNNYYNYNYEQSPKSSINNINENNKHNFQVFNGGDSFKQTFSIPETPYDDYNEFKEDEDLFLHNNKFSEFQFSKEGFKNKTLRASPSSPNTSKSRRSSIQSQNGPTGTTGNKFRMNSLRSESSYRPFTTNQSQTQTQKQNENNNRNTNMNTIKTKTTRVKDGNGRTKSLTIETQERFGSYIITRTQRKYPSYPSIECSSPAVDSESDDESGNSVYSDARETQSEENTREDRHVTAPGPSGPPLPITRQTSRSSFERHTPAKRMHALGRMRKLLRGRGGKNR